MTDLHDIAPRLAKARDQRIVELRVERRQRQMDAINSMGITMAEASKRIAVSLEAWQRLLPKAKEHC